MHDEIAVPQYTFKECEKGNMCKRNSDKVLVFCWAVVFNTQVNFYMKTVHSQILSIEKLNLIIHCKRLLLLRK